MSCCAYCGGQIDKEANSCAHCGAPTHVPASSSSEGAIGVCWYCGKERNDEAETCGHCGAPSQPTSCGDSPGGRALQGILKDQEIREYLKRHPPPPLPPTPPVPIVTLVEPGRCPNCGGYRTNNVAAGWGCGGGVVLLGTPIVALVLAGIEQISCTSGAGPEFLAPRLYERCWHEFWVDFALICVFGFLLTVALFWLTWRLALAGAKKCDICNYAWDNTTTVMPTGANRGLIATADGVRMREAAEATGKWLRDEKRARDTLDHSYRLRERNERWRREQGWWF